METLMVVPVTSGSTELIVDRLGRAVAAASGPVQGAVADPLAASRVQVELWIRWMQEIRRLKLATVCRRVSVVAGFYRTCVIDGVLDPGANRVPPSTSTGRHRNSSGDAWIAALVCAQGRCAILAAGMRVV